MSILKECRDYEILKKNLSEVVLKSFEEEINKYLNGQEECIDGFRSSVVNWYEGCVDTEQLISDYK